MKQSLSQILALVVCGLFVASGSVVQLASAMDKPGGSSAEPNLESMSEVTQDPSAGVNTQWSDQLKRERDEAKKSMEQAKKERDQAKKERVQAAQASKQGSQGGSGQQSIQAQSGSSESGQQGQEQKRMIQERDQFLQERDALQKETANIRQERDRAMSAISGGSALDAVDSGMPTTRR
ncbi:MAG: hypothetical protein NPIRA04_20150 [Nitrospirales bacterium]|nr:MAG: hypothetical protein NPIRA04_20150 [Nitrospirales bacterium]